MSCMPRRISVDDSTTTLNPGRRRCTACAWGGFILLPTSPASCWARSPAAATSSTRTACAPPRPRVAAYKKLALSEASTSQPCQNERAAAVHAQSTHSAAGSRRVRARRCGESCAAKADRAKQMSWPVGYGRKAVATLRLSAAARPGAEGSAATRCGRQMCGNTCIAASSGIVAGKIWTEKRYHHRPRLGVRSAAAGAQEQRRAGEQPRDAKRQGAARGGLPRQKATHLGDGWHGGAGGGAAVRLRLGGQQREGHGGEEPDGVGRYVRAECQAGSCCGRPAGGAEGESSGHRCVRQRRGGEARAAKDDVRRQEIECRREHCKWSSAWLGWRRRRGWPRWGRRILS
eukprot:scaffold881_cov123-Isochrysis_galbana.AAC.11